MKKVKSKLSLLLLGGIVFMVLASVESCSKSSSTPITPIGGFDSSGAVEPQALVAYWNFDNQSNETISGTAAYSTGVTYGTGIKGEAYQGAAGAFDTLPVPAAFNSLPSYSISFWYQLPAQIVNNAGVGPNNAQGLFFVSPQNPGSYADLIYELDQPNGTQIGTDTIPIHTGFTNLASAGWQGFTMAAYDTSTFNNDWIHVVTTYDASTSTYVIYQDGLPILNQSAFGTATSNILYQGALGSTPPPALQGALGFTNSTSTDKPTSITIGTWPAGLYGVSSTRGGNGCFLGKLDELRVYNIAISQKDVTGLYLNGLSGR